MGAPVQRQGDANGAGGVITSGIASVLVNGRPIATPGLSVTPHPPCNPKSPTHCTATTTGGSGSVFAEGRPILLTSDTDTCGHTRAGGSADVRAA